METTPRQEARRRVLKTGIIAYNSRFKTLTCTVRDLSEHGARLRVDNPTMVPSHFELIIELDGFEVDCEITWRQDMEIGVRFLGTPRQRAQLRKQVITAVIPEGRPTLRRKPLSLTDGPARK